MFTVQHKRNIYCNIHKSPVPMIMGQFRRRVGHCKIFSCGNIKIFIIPIEFVVSCTQQTICCYIYNEILGRSNEYLTSSFKHLTAVECTFMTDDTSQSWAQLKQRKRDSPVGGKMGSKMIILNKKKIFYTKTNLKLFSQVKNN